MRITDLGLALENAVHFYGEEAGALTQAASHHLATPGKRTRSKLLFAASSKPINLELLAHSAAAIELIHEASVVHDDIQDRTEYRRGEPSVWQKFGANTALLLGDHFVSAAFRAIAEVDVNSSMHAKLLIMMSQAISRAASGQHLQLSSTIQSADLTKIYTEVAVSKTGAFIALPLQFSNLIGHDQILNTEPARLCGEQLGLAYQILDDLRPFATPTTLVNDEDIIGKVITAPVAAIKSIAPSEDPFEALIRQTSHRDLALDLCRIWQTQAITRAVEYAAKLPAHTIAVIKKFIDERLRNDASMSTPNAANTIQLPHKAYQRWPNNRTKSTKVI